MSINDKDDDSLLISKFYRVGNADEATSVYRELLEIFNRMSDVEKKNTSLKIVNVDSELFIKISTHDAIANEAGVSDLFEFAESRLQL